MMYGERVLHVKLITCPKDIELDGKDIRLIRNICVYYKWQQLGVEVITHNM